MDTSSYSWIACIVIFTAIAAVWDQRTKRLPNVLTVPAFVAALIFHLVRGAWEGGLAGAGSGLLFALGGFATGFGILLVLWLVGGGGGGDVKFMGALGAWLGATLTLQVFIVGTLFVAAGSIGIVVWHTAQAGFGRTRRKYLETSESPQYGAQISDESRQAALIEQQQKRRLMPFGVPVALATWVVLAVTQFCAGA